MPASVCSRYLHFQTFAYKITIDSWVFALAGTLAVSIALLTVSFQSIKAALANPVKRIATTLNGPPARPVHDFTVDMLAAPFRLKFVIFLYCYAEKTKRSMATLLLEVNTEQEEALKKLLQYMNITFQKVSSTDTDFWESLSPAGQNRIERGLLDAEAGRYVPAQSVIDQLMGNR